MCCGRCNLKSNHSGDGGVIRVLLVDDDVPILEVSERVLLMMGNFEIDHALSAEEAFKKLESRSYDIVVSDYEMPEKTGLDFLEEMRGGKNSSIPFILFTGKGREEIAVKALNLGANAYISKQGNLETVYGELSHAIVDTVESKRAADAFADSDAKFRALIQNADDTIVLNDLHGKCIFRNQAYFRNLGFDEEGASEAEDFAKIHPDDLPIVRKKAQELSKNGSSTFEYRVKHRNGSWVYRYAKSTVIYNSCYQPYAILSIIRDVSEYKKAEELLKLSEQRYRELADCLPEIVFEVDSEANLVFANSKSYELTGYSKEDIAGGFNVLRLISSEEKDKASKNLQRVFSGKKGSPTEYTLIRKDGTSFPVLISTAPIVKEGKVVGGRGTIIDITERKKAEEEMQVASNLFRLARDAIFVHDMEGRIIYFNEATCKQTGYNEEEMSSMNLHALDAPESARLIQERW
jgi:PAS domain S-box-containing protein